MFNRDPFYDHATQKPERERQHSRRNPAPASHPARISDRSTDQPDLAYNISIAITIACEKCFRVNHTLLRNVQPDRAQKNSSEPCMKKTDHTLIEKW
jgi:hypothetical protein